MKELDWKEIRSIVRKADEVLARYDKRDLVRLNEESYYRIVLEEYQKEHERPKGPIQDLKEMCIGAAIDYKGKTYKCVEDDNKNGGCDLCAFNAETCSMPLGACDAEYRLDHKYCHFEQVTLEDLF